MLIFIYMNQRVLDQFPNLLLGDWVEKPDDKQVELKEFLLAFKEELSDDELEEGEEDEE